MTPDLKPTGAHAEAPPTEVQLQLHTDIESLQVQVRALGSAVNHLCRALEVAVPELQGSSEAATALEDARLCLGEVW
jgi:hypothetical protein